MAMHEADIRAIVVETLAEQQRLHRGDLDAIVLKTIATILTSFGIEEEDRKELDIAETLVELHQLTFFRGAPIPDFDHGHWWIAFHDKVPAAFAGVVPSTHVGNAGYFCRVGVLQEHCGHGRLMRALERRARRNGWSHVVSDTTDNLFSANNFIRAGYRLFRPRSPWAWPHTLYWRKTIATGG
jgi:GNAT superfamily N-acetyltransferase